MNLFKSASRSREPDVHVVMKHRAKIQLQHVNYAQRRFDVRGIGEAHVENLHFAIVINPSREGSPRCTEVIAPAALQCARYLMRGGRGHAVNVHTDVVVLRVAVFIISERVELNRKHVICRVTNLLAREQTQGASVRPIDNAVRSIRCKFKGQAVSDDVTAVVTKNLECEGGVEGSHSARYVVLQSHGVPEKQLPTRAVPIVYSVVPVEGVGEISAVVVNIFQSGNITVTGECFEGEIGVLTSNQNTRKKCPMKKQQDWCLDAPHQQVPHGGK